METKHGTKYRQLHIEDYLREIPAEQGRGTGVYAHEWITGDPGTDTDFWTDKLLDIILRSDNLNAAYKRVKTNRGTGGIDGMQVDELLPYLKDHRDELVRQLREGKYKPTPVRRVEIPKEEKGKVRKLGIPTVVDRMMQQAIAQELTPVYEAQFSDNSYGFRPGRSAHDALAKCRKYVNEGYVYAISMDLQAYFDTVNHSKLIEVLSRTIKDGRVISLIHKYLNAGVMEDGGIRAVYWKQWKRVRTRYKMLRALHLPEWKVHEMANCRKGTWRAAEMLNSVLTKKILVDRLGYPSMTAHYLKVRVNY